MDLTQEEWASKLKNDPNAVVLDVRTEGEVMQGIIPNAINIDIYKGQGFIYKLEELDKLSPNLIDSVEKEWDKNWNSGCGLRVKKYC